MAQRKTVEKWERDLSVVLVKVFSEDGKKIVKVKCAVCEEFSSRINSIAGYSDAWVNGTTSVKLDGLKKHTQGGAHERAKQLHDQKTLGEKFVARIVEESPIGRGLKKMAEMDKEVMLTRFNSAYYLAKSERPYSDAEGLITLHEMNGMTKSGKFRNERSIASLTDSIGDKLREDLLAELKKARYYSLLTDGSTDKGVIEQEALYLLFMSEEGNKICIN